MNNEEKILAMLDKLTSDMAEMKTDMAEMKTTQTAQGEQLAAQGEQLAALGEQLAAQGERLLNIEMRIENTIIPDIKALAGGHMQLLETLAKLTHLISTPILSYFLMKRKGYLYEKTGNHRKKCGDLCPLFLAQPDGAEHRGATSRMSRIRQAGRLYHCR